MDKGSRAGQVAVFQKSSFIMSFKDAIIFLTLLAVAFLLGLSATLYEFVPMQGWKKIPVPKQKGRKKLLFIPEGWRKKVEFKHIKCKSWAGIIKRHRRRSNQQGSNVGKKIPKRSKHLVKKAVYFEFSSTFISIPKKKRKTPSSCGIRRQKRPPRCKAHPLSYAKEAKYNRSIFWKNNQYASFTARCVCGLAAFWRLFRIIRFSNAHFSTASAQTSQRLRFAGCHCYRSCSVVHTARSHQKRSYNVFFVSCNFLKEKKRINQCNGFRPKIWRQMLFWARHHLPYTSLSFS